jgi:hypothetical protein
VKELPLLMVQNFRVKEGKFKEFQDWVEKSKSDFDAWGKKAGWKYQGVYYYALGTGAPVNADGCMMWEISKYADIDTSRGTFKDPLDEKINKAFVELLMNEPSPVFILRPQSDALIYEGM